MAKKKSVKKQPAEPVLDWIAEDLRPLAVEIEQLQPDTKNARRHSEQNIRAIAASLREFGQLKPIVVNRTTKTIEAGNGTLEAARQLGWTHLAAVWVDHDPHAAIGFAIADNRTAELANWDDALLAELLAGVQESTPDLYADLLLDELQQPADGDATDDAGEDTDAASQAFPDTFPVVVDCRDEDDQKDLCQRLQKEGRKCRLLTGRRKNRNQDLP